MAVMGDGCGSSSAQKVGDAPAAPTVPSITLDCRPSSHPSSKRISVIPDNPPKNSHWGFLVNVLGPKKDSHSSAWGEVDYKNAQRGGKTHYAIGPGSLPATPRNVNLPDIPLHTIPVNKDLGIKVYTPQSGQEGTINFACYGNADKTTVLTPYHVTFS